MEVTMEHNGDGCLMAKIVTRGEEQYVILPEGISLGTEVDVTSVPGGMLLRPLGPTDIDPISMPSDEAAA